MVDQQGTKRTHKEATTIKSHNRNHTNEEQIIKEKTERAALESSSSNFEFAERTKRAPYQPERSGNC
jgi:hypothetical protein